MSVLAAIGVLLIILALVHVVPLVLGLVLGALLLLFGTGVSIGGRRRGPPL